MRIIPRKTKIKIEIFKGIHLADFLVGLLFMVLALFVAASDAAGKWYITVGLILFGATLLVKVGDEPNYLFFLSVFRHLAYRKSYRKNVGGKKDVSNLSSFKAIENGFIVYNDYYGAAIEIPPVEFRFFSPFRRSISIDECLGNVLRSLNINYSANLVKIERRVPYDGYIENEKKKIIELRHCYECGLISEEEFQAKCEVVFDRGRELEKLNSENRTVAPYYYLVFFDSDRNQLRLQVDTAINVLERGEMRPKRLDSKGLALFLKYTNDIDFDEKELDGLDESEYAAWAMPEAVQIKQKECRVNDITTYTMVVSNYPLRVGDAWIAGVMSIPATKVVVKLRPMDKQKTVRNIDHSISELRGRFNHTGVDSSLMEITEHINSLSELLSTLQSDNEVLLNTDIYVTCYDVQLTKKEGREAAVADSHRASITNMRNVVRRAYREAELRLYNLQFNQMEGYVGSQISGYDPLFAEWGRGIPGSTAAAMFPWIYAHVQDPMGIKLGAEDGIPVFIDMFRRDSERVNSNVVIVGKSGSGKSYAAKSILVNLAADNSKIFVLDPENEYSELAENLHGKFINVGNAQQGRMNPFHIITALEDDEAGNGITGSYASHMQFLEEFFKQILPDCEKEALEYLNTVADRVYMKKGITAETNLSLLRPEDYPTFSDVYDEILKEFQSTDNEYLRSILRTLMNYVSKFSAGGRNANIWNGPSTVTTDENFTVFNFQSLLAGGNKTVTNAQMLLVMKYIDNEIIKNREYNNRYGTNRKIVVVIDEAHVFIDEKYPIALDFMYQLAKRIRKYNGMQIVITQNIKDFVGSEEISRKSSAIINACQYSFIFSLAPNDMADLCKLYEKAGGINENEQDKIVTAPRGNAFVILSPTSRSSFQVEVPEDVIRVFEQRNIGTRYFEGEDGQESWLEFLGKSREKYLENRRAGALLPAYTEKAEPSELGFDGLTEEEYELELDKLRAAERAKPSRVTFTEVTEEEYERELAGQREAEKAKQTVPEIRPERNVSFTEAVAEEEPQPSSALQPVRAETAQTQSGAERTSDLGEMTLVISELRRIADTVGRFTYDAMVNDVVERLRQSTPASVEASLLNGTMSAAVLTEGREAPPAQAGTGQTRDILDMLLREEEPVWEEPHAEESEEVGESDEQEEMSLTDYLNKLAIEEQAKAEIETADTDERDEELESKLFGNDDKRLDILSFLEQAAAELDELTILDDMADNGEHIRTITLEELINLNKNRKKQ